MEYIKSAIAFKVVSVLLDTNSSFFNPRGILKNIWLHFFMTKAVFFNMLLKDILTKDYNVFNFIEHK